MNEEQIKVWREEAMKLFSDNYLSSENIAPTSYLKGFLAAKTSSYERELEKAQEEINFLTAKLINWSNGSLEKAQRENLAIQDKNIEYLVNEVRQLKEELKREREAVDFYANRKNWQTPESQGFIVDDSCAGIADMIEEFDSRGSNCGGNKARQTQQQRKVEL